MPYVFSEIPVPSFRTPTGLTPWWRPVAVGWPTTGATASYVGPRTAAPRRNVGTSSPELLADYFRKYRRSKFVEVPAIPSGARAFGAGVDLSPYKLITAQPPKAVSRGSVITTIAGPMLLPDGAWVPTLSPALMPGGF